MATDKNSFKVQGEDLLKEIKKLIHEGNIRRILIKDEKGLKTFIEIPVTVGVVGVLLIPVLAAVGALAAMVGLVTVEIIKNEDSKTGSRIKSGNSAYKVAQKKAGSKSGK